MQHAEDVHVSLMWDFMIPLLQDDQMTSFLQRQHMNRQVKCNVEDPFSFLSLNRANHVQL